MSALGLAPGDEPHVVGHLVQLDRDGVGLALHHHADAVAHEDHVDAGQVDEAGERGVVGGDHGDPLLERLHPARSGTVTF